VPLHDAHKHVIISVNWKNPRTLAAPTFGYHFKQFFGLDIGGTMGKLCFFEPITAVSPQASPNQGLRHTPVPARTAAGSSAGIQDDGQQRLLDRSLRGFRDLIMSRESYGSSGRRDAALSFDFQGGRFHFLHFNTCRWVDATALCGIATETDQPHRRDCCLWCLDSCQN